MATILDFEEHARLIDTFVAEVPRLLEGNPITADLAARVEVLTQLSETPFTLAVIGQMRSGKSTLLNSLIGKDLALTGVKETTATVNWFKFGEGELLQRFRVHWRETPPEEYLLGDIHQWAGDSERASATAFLEFFDNAEFLRNIYIVDTPGTRSVIKSHEETVQQFLAEKREPSHEETVQQLSAEKRERETLRHGGAADAILYVFMPVARESDEALLGSFERTTRLPGSSPFNSFAVVHKWEAIEAEDVFAEAQRKAERIAKQLKDYVSDVLPVSAPLAIAASRLSIGFWTEAALFVRETSAAVFSTVINLGEELFCNSEFKGCKFSAESRSKLLRGSGLPWPCFRALLQQAKRRELVDAESLCRLASEMAGIQTLIRLLNERFFSRVRLIKSFTLLARALEPCRIAQMRLSQRASDLRHSDQLGREALASLSALPSQVTEAAQRFIRDALVDNETQSKALARLERALTSHIRDVSENFEQLNADAECLRLVDQDRVHLQSSERDEVRSVLGCHGSSPSQRWACYTAGGEALRDRLGERIDYWSAHAETSFSAERVVAEQMTSRLSALADVFERELHPV